MLSDQQIVFIDRFILKLREVPADLIAGETDTEALEAAVREWTKASGTVDERIAKLSQVLVSSGDPELKQIAEFGVNAVSGNHKVRLQAAIMGLRGGGDSLPKEAIKALPIVRSFRAHVAKSESIAACDENPFGVTVDMRSTLGPALDRLADELKRVAA